MRVLHIFKTYLPDSFGGVEHVIWQIAEGTVRFGIDSDVLSLSADPHKDPLIVGSHRAHKAKLNLDVASTGLSLPLFAKASALAREADILHYHFPWPMMDLVHLTLRTRKPAVVTYHSDIVRQKRLLALYQPLMHRFLSSVDCIVATSPNYIAGSDVLRRYHAKTRVIPIGIDDMNSPGPASVSRWREEVGQDFFLFVGALRYYKGLSFLIEAARSTGHPVVVAGKGVLSDAVDVPENVRLVGEVSEVDKIALLSLCKAFVFPSHLRSEAFGVALLEAARAGKAMISCEIGTGTSYVNVDGLTGFTVRPGDPAVLSGAMERLARDECLAERFGEAARARYETHFTGEKMSERYAALYDSLAR